jgi:hypothetical protein
LTVEKSAAATASPRRHNATTMHGEIVEQSRSNALGAINASAVE